MGLIPHVRRYGGRDRGLGPGRDRGGRRLRRRVNLCFSGLWFFRHCFGFIERCERLRVI